MTNSTPDHVATPIDWRDSEAVASAVDLIVSVFADPIRYARSRIAGEVLELEHPCERTFFAVWMDGRMVGVGGVKSADWASNTHILYLSAVDSAYRGRGIGRALVKARVEWILSRNREGRILVSSTRPKRYRQFGFSALPLRQSAKARLMLLEFGPS